MLKYINYFLGLTFSLSLLGNLAPNREMIILLDTRNLENIHQTLNEEPLFDKPEGLGAISAIMLIALYQQAAPIITNKSLIKNILEHQTIFRDFTTLNLSSLQKKYGKFNKFKTPQLLKDFQEQCLYINKNIALINQILEQKIRNEDLNHIYSVLDDIIKDNRFTIKSAPVTLKRLNQDNAAMQAFQLEMTLYTLCSWINLEKDWDMKQVNDDIFLLIPKNYIKKFNLPVSPPSHPQASPLFTDLEIKLGLKLDHMRQIDQHFFESSYFQTLAPSQIPFRESLKQIFITHEDLKKASLLYTTPYRWSFYMSGHGTPSRIEVEIFPQLINLKNLLQKKIDSPLYSSCRLFEENSTEKIQVPSSHLLTCNHHKAFQDLVENLKKLNKEIEEVTLILSEFDTTELEGTINSLTIQDFIQILQFFNNDIETAIFYYSSCFAGGNHLIKPFLKDGEPLALKYPVICSTPSDNKTLQELPIINIPPYAQTGISIAFEPSEIHSSDIDIKHKKLGLTATLHFDNFFSVLRKGILNNKERLLLACYSLHPHVDESGKIINQNIPSIPLIRLANATSFQPIPYDTSSLIIYDTHGSQSLVVNTSATLIFNEYIPGKITLERLNQEETPQIISMVPGFALHVFEDVCSSILDIGSIVNTFLTFSELSSPKIFWIKNLKCLNNDKQHSKQETFKDVIIMRKIFNSNTLAASSHNQAVTLESCAYFTDHRGAEFKLTWEGAFIGQNNFKITPWLPKEHKEECLNCFPHLKNFLSHIVLPA